MQQIQALEAQISSEIPMIYHHLNQDEKKPLLVFLHGYSDSAQSFLRRSFPHLDQRFEILAVNGLFPVPQKKDNVWKQAFAWYFADFSANSILIHPKISANAVSHLIERLNLTERPKIIIGFSQGGFFLPFLLPLLKNVKHLITIGAAYREQDYAKALDIPLDAVHGTDDEIIPIEHSENSFNTFQKTKNPKGSFYKFEGLAHTMNDESRAWLLKKIESIFPGL